jgi:hypothetical protein
MDWYRVLRVRSDATQTAIRAAFKQMALLTHPDKTKFLTSATSLGTSGDHDDKLPSFVEVREAAGILLDPLQRAAFDGQRVNQLVRSEGRISSTLEDGDISEVVWDDETLTLWAVVECRCGGEYRVLLSQDAPGGGRYVCECESCSLVVELIVSGDYLRQVVAQSCHTL